MASRRLDVGQGALAWLVAGSLLMASACSSDSSVDFDPTTSGGETNSGGSKPSSSGSGSGATQSGGSSNGDAGETTGGTGSAAGKNSGGQAQGGKGGTSGAGGKAGSANGGSESGGTNGGGGKGGSESGGSNAGNGGNAGISGNAGNGGMAGAGGSAGNAGSGGSGGANNDCVAAAFGGHAYYFCGVVESAVAAYAKCQSLGMKMVEIESMAEHTFVTGKQKGQSWLGGTDELKEGEWRWASTTQVFWNGGPRVVVGPDGRVDGVYSNFIVGQPNNNNVDGFPENCLAINANGWNDLYCSLPDVRAACEATGPVVLPNQ